MKNIRPTSSLLALAALALGGLVTSATVQAGNVSWTVGVSSPGVQVGVSSGGYYGGYQPTYVDQYPVYVQPQPVYVAPRPFVYVRPAPVYVTQYEYAPVEWQRPGPGWRQGHRHHPHNGYHSGGYDRDDRGGGRQSGYRR